jgi:hypothetical protein
MARPRFGVRSLMIWIAVGTVALAVLGSVRNFFSPPDWVEVTVQNAPSNIDGIYIIAETRAGPLPLPWYHSKVYTFTFDPRQAGSELDTGPDGVTRRADVQWIDAERYGILAQKKDGTWLLWWLGPGGRQGPSILRYLNGGGSATLRVPDDPARAEIPSEDFMRRVGLPPKDRR